MKLATGPHLILGTAQLGIPYGVANRKGMPDPQAATALLRAAYDGGVRFVETAQAYGESENILERHYAADPERRLGVITKLSPGVDFADRAAQALAVDASSRRFGGRLEALLLHDADHLAALRQEPGRWLLERVERGEIGALGVSVYTPAEFEAALSIEAIRVIQAPFSGLDRRLLDSGLLAAARRAGKAILVRSAFLQGLLLMGEDAVPAAMDFARPALAGWRKLCSEHRLDPCAAALNYIQASVPDASVIVGCEELAQLEKNIRVWRAPALPGSFVEAVGRLPAPEERVVDPRFWPGPAVAILQARMGSTRLPGKATLPIVDGKGALELMLERVSRSRLLTRVIVATTTLEEDAPIEALCRRLGVACFRGHPTDVLDRYFQCATVTGARGPIVRLTGDCPLHDPEVIDRVIAAFQAGGLDYVSNAHPPSYPDGLDAEVFSYPALKRAWTEARQGSEREHVTLHLYSHPDRFRIGNVAHEADLSSHRWTLDEPRDLSFIRAVFGELGSRPFSTKDVLDLLARRPELARLNQDIRRDEGLAKSLAEDARRRAA